MTRDAWLSAHPYLRPMAQWCGRVERAAAEVVTSHAGAPRWDDCGDDFGAGVPLLSSDSAGLDRDAAGKAIAALVERLGAEPTADPLAADTRRLGAELAREAGAARRAVDWLLGELESAPGEAPGLLRYLGWCALARHLRPLVTAYERWRTDDRWQRRYC